MGLVDCDKHGLTGLLWGISKDVQQHILDDRPITSDELVYIKLPEADFLYLDKAYVLDKKLYDSLNLKNIPVTTKDDVHLLNKILDPYLTGICIRCYIEYIEKYELPSSLIEIFKFTGGV